MNWSLDRFGAHAARHALRRGARSGHHGQRSTSTLGAETLVDLEARFDVTERIRFALGAENVFDEYPDAFPVARNTTGNTPFSNYSPFGRSGRFLYGRVSFGF